MSKSFKNSQQARRIQEHKKRIKSPAKPAFVDHLQNTRDSKNHVRSSTALIYHDEMVDHKCLWDPNYPERPERFSRIMDRCREYGLIDRCQLLEPREAYDDELLKLHTADRLELLHGTDGSPDAEALEALSSGYDAVFIHPKTHKLARLAAGSAVELVDAVVDGRVHNGMAVVRPPGHHAMKSEFCGYCFYNNVAVAARHALDNKDVSRILIVDWDVHHGQATQQMFYDDPRVLYFSIHRYERGSFWPNLRESDYHYVGQGAGHGFNVNVPLNRTGLGDADYMAIFHQLLLPLAYEYRPELIIVSAGYDAALGCFEGEMEVTPACYAHLTSSLMALAGGRLAVVLEGGYCLKSLAEGAALTLRALLGDPCPAIGQLPSPSESVQESILSSICVLRPLWKCFQYQGQFAASVAASVAGREENQFWPRVLFEGSDVKETKFATRNCYEVQSAQVIEQLDRRLDQIISATNLSVAANRVCLIFDERMTQHRNVSEPGHPERPARITSIYELMDEYGLVERCLRLEARQASRKQLLMLHDGPYVDLMASLPKMKQSTLNELQNRYGSVYLCPESYDAALLAAGSAVEIVRSILSGESRSGVGIIRPPGHHAECNEAYGFCLFNNTALAAKYAIEDHHLERVLVVDWDVHHGNGIQRMFEEDPRVLYVSLHRLDLFPMQIDEADCNVVGRARGAGYTVNIAWPKRGMGDSEYLAAFQQVIMPVAYQYEPQLVLVAAGFDAAQGDPLGGCRISPEGYAHMTHMLTSLAGGRVAILLEGGYNLSSISHSMTMCCKALLGDPLPAVQIGSVQPAAVDTIRRVIDAQRPYWKCLSFAVDLPDQDVLRSPWLTDAQVLRNNPLLAGTAEETPEKPNQEPEAALVQLMEQLRVEPVEPRAEPADQDDQLLGVTGGPAEDQDDQLLGATGGPAEHEVSTLQQFLLLPENIE